MTLCALAGVGATDQSRTIRMSEIGLIGVQFGRAFVKPLVRVWKGDQPVGQSGFDLLRHLGIF